MPAYQAFATRTAALPPDQRATAFRKEFAVQYPDYYSPEVFGDDTKMQSRAERFFDPAKRDAAFPDRPALTEARVAEMGAVIGPQMPQDDPAWFTLWLEGLATYVSQRMNPSLNAQQVLWFPRDIVVRMQKDTPRAAKLLLADLDKTGSPADRWFLMGTEVEGLPDRAGYYLGYLFAKSVGDGVPLPKLARMSLPEVHEQEREFLTRLGQP